MAKKLGVVAVLCLAVFSGFASALAGQLNVKSQATLYKQTTTHIAWQVKSPPPHPSILSYLDIDNK